jgi:phosphotriesterase-related protein
MKKLIHIFVILLILLLAGCSPKVEKVIITVNGPIPAADLGTTLVHEHVLVDFIGADSTGYHRWDKDKVVTVVAPYLAEIREYGVNTLIECTPAYIGRDPVLLQKLSAQTGMQLVTNTGYYGAWDNRFLPAHFYEMSVRELAAMWTDEHEQGINGSGVKPGFIKIAVGPSDTLSEEHIKIVSAAALTHNNTGLVIASHTGPDGPAFAQISILQSYGVDPSHFIWVHAQHGTLEGNIKAAKMGSWISLDNLNARRDRSEPFGVEWYADRIASLKENGLLHRVMISHDAGWYSPGEENGGEFRGYTAIFSELIPVLKERGFTQQEIDQLLVLNPSRAFAIDGTI